MLSSLLAAIACAGTYLLYAGTVSASELAMAGVLGLLGGLWSVAARRTDARRFSVSRLHFHAWLSAAGSLPIATVRTGWWLILSAAGRASSTGRADIVRFRDGLRNDPAEGARRATAVLAASLAPASYVVRVEPGTDNVLIHSIDGRPARLEAEWLT